MPLHDLRSNRITRRSLLQAGGAMAALAAMPRALAADAARFPDGFRWGVASAAAQAESRKGRGQSIWDVFADQKRNIHDGSTNVVNTEFETRYAEELALLQDAGVNAFRFSFAWPRIQPDGPGEPNAEGIATYNRIIDEMLRRGIEPLPTMIHWDLPVWAGNYSERDITGRMADYAGILTREFGDRIGKWIVLNEPNTVAAGGYAFGMHAPGLASAAMAGAAMHYQNLGTGLMIAAARANLPADARVGTTLNIEPARPGSESAEDVEAARHADAFWNGAFLDPLFGRDYPELVRPLVDPFVQDGDMSIIAAKPDFIGINYYAHMFVQAEPRSPLGFAPVLKHFPRGLTLTQLFPVEPAGLTETLLWVHETYGAPEIYITETGFAVDDPQPVDGVVDDPNRVEYLRSYLLAAHDAIGKGVNLKGLFYWASTDNWEWSEGFSKTFGLIQIDRETQARTPKKSLAFYGSCARSNSVA